MPVHPITECDRLLRASGGFDPFRCKPDLFECSCGRVWAHLCDEAGGCSYREVKLPSRL